VIAMSKRGKIFVGVGVLVYVIALVVFHVTYDYATYFEEEADVIIRYSLIYIAVALILYYILMRRAKFSISNLTIKTTTKIVAYASVLKAILCICPVLINGYFVSAIPFGYTIAWLVISVFFFTLHKNMQ
jgi:hypothetical protein